MLTNLPPKIILWYDRSIMLWTALYQDRDGNQVGNAGYGATKKDAISDVAYQNTLPVAGSTANGI